ncbi:MAG: replication initiation protein [Syntrophorhabdus sp.]|nr:replication initiation protein [Syntrophorhabdus sp.]
MVRDAATAEEIVYQSNSLVMRKTSLSLIEQRLLLSILAQIQPEDADFKPYRLAVKEFLELCGIHNGRMHAVIDSVIVPFARKVVRVEREDGSVLVTHWFSSADYKRGRGIIEFSFDPKLKPVLLRLREQLNYTRIPLRLLLSAPGIYASRLYEICSAHVFKDNGYGAEFTVEVEELREMLGIEKNKLQLFKNLNTVALKPALKFINERTPLNVTMQLNKHGHRYVVQVKFVVSKKPLAEGRDTNILPTLLQLVPVSYRDTPTVVASIADAVKAGIYTIIQLQNIIKAASQGKKRNYPAYLKVALIKGYNKDGEATMKEKKHPYAGRQVEVLSVREMGLADIEANTNGKPVAAILQNDGSLWLDGKLQMTADAVTAGLRKGTVRFV